MNGRLELQEKDFIKIEEMISYAPAFVKNYYVYLKASNKSAKTIHTYLRIVLEYIKSINARYYRVVPEDLTSTSIREYMIDHQTKITKEGKIESTSHSQSKVIWSSLNSLFTFLSEEEYINDNPMNKIKRPKGSDEARINENRILLNKSDFRKIMIAVENGAGSHKAKCRQENTKSRDKLIMHIFMNTGIRESALCSLNIDDINTEDNTMKVYDKGNLFHSFILSDQIIELYNSWLIDREKYAVNTNALFVTDRGDRINVNTISALVKKYTNEALGKPLSPHKLRAGVCSILYKETKDIEFVRRFIGHSDVSVTKRYIVTKGEELEKGSKILSSIF